MVKHQLCLGAIDVKTKEYVYPYIAIKTEKYKCPECEEMLIFKKGTVNRPHFAHQKNGNCTFYNKPSESQVHKDAKRQLETVLSRKDIRIERILSCCGKRINNPIGIVDDSEIKLEHRFQFNGKTRIADVACVEKNGNIKYIFEICHTHATRSGDRPEPWFELSAGVLITQFNKGVYILKCMRDEKCGECEEKECLLKNVILNRNRMANKC